MLGKPVREMLDQVLRHTNAGLTRAGVKPGWAYALALVSAVATSAAFLSDLLWVGLAMLVLHGIFDYLDGGLRRACGQGNRRPRWLGMDAHAVVDKTSEVVLLVGLVGGRWIGWPLGMAAAASSVAVTVVGSIAKRWLDIAPSRALFDRTDRLFVLLLAGTFRAFDIALALVCAMNGVILLQRATYILLAIRTRDRTA